ncbi:hypothetical protein V9L05_12570 [Bernardetia sp. Wsw4-3y2]|uniref:hypothetical protein n=1 Tax=Bernardetia sp. Wsw4-3y2 TaxID=3127471 RepID=UPI0030D00024
MSQENYCYIISSYSFAFNDDYNYIISYEGGFPQSTYDKLEDAQKACKKANYKRWRELLEGEFGDMYNDIPLNNSFVWQEDIKGVKAIFEKEGIEFSSKMTDEQIERMIQLFTQMAKNRHVEKTEVAINETKLTNYKDYVWELVRKIGLPYEKQRILEKFLEKETKWRRINESDILQEKLKAKVLDLVELNQFYHIEKAVFVDE